ncbi:hypothetical protein ACJ73_05180 [Blastomyces percursus]|uniref:Uncharacterized protein n=1 Tax=Blastomyces percursus TaxID=1658174 RepID=A0A1J9Q4I9_9EURO|nr:hypothetical protein ACJ73_05180 [Blastomyces percursus]
MYKPSSPHLKPPLPLREASESVKSGKPPYFESHHFLENLFADVRLCVLGAKAEAVPVVTPAGNKLVETVQRLHSKLHDSTDLGLFENFSLNDFLDRVLNSRLNSDEATNNQNRYDAFLMNEALPGEEAASFCERQTFKKQFEQANRFWLSQLAKLHIAALVKVKRWPERKVQTEGTKSFEEEYTPYFLPCDKPREFFQYALRCIVSPACVNGNSQSDDAAGTQSRGSNTSRGDAMTILQRINATGIPFHGSNTPRGGAMTLLQRSNTTRTPSRDSNTPRGAPMTILQRSNTTRTPSRDSNTPRGGGVTILRRSDTTGNPFRGRNTPRGGAVTILQRVNAAGTPARGSNAPRGGAVTILQRSSTSRTTSCSSITPRGGATPVPLPSDADVAHLFVEEDFQLYDDDDQRTIRGVNIDS